VQLLSGPNQVVITTLGVAAAPGGVIPTNILAGEVGAAVGLPETHVQYEVAL
jgi:hypothetical protein